VDYVRMSLKTGAVLYPIWMFDDIICNFEKPEWAALYDDLKNFILDATCYISKEKVISLLSKLTQMSIDNDNVLLAEDLYCMMYNNYLSNETKYIVPFKNDNLNENRVMWIRYNPGLLPIDTETVKSVLQYKIVQRDNMDDESEYVEIQYPDNRFSMAPLARYAKLKNGKVWKHFLKEGLAT
jgi:hypothetical protein